MSNRQLRRAREARLFRHARNTVAMNPGFRVETGEHKEELGEIVILEFAQPVQRIAFQHGPLQRLIDLLLKAQAYEREPTE